MTHLHAEGEGVAADIIPAGGCPRTLSAACLSMTSHLKVGGAGQVVNGGAEQVLGRRRHLQRDAP